MKKIPKQRQDKPPQIKSLEPGYYPDEHPPRFSFRLIVKHPDFGYDSLEKEHKIALINRINVLGNIPWKDLRTLDRNRGYEKINREQLRFSVPNEVPSESEIIRFRFSDKAPMLGYRSTFGTFYIIAFDTKFIAYDHG